MVEEPLKCLLHFHYGPENDTELTNDPVDPASERNYISYPGQFLTRIDSSGSVGSPVTLKLVVLIQPNLSHEQDNPQAHNGYHYNRIVRERGRKMIQKIWRGGQEQAVVGIFYYARIRQHQVAPKGKMRDIVREETALESRNVESIFGQGQLSKPGSALSS